MNGTGYIILVIVVLAVIGIVLALIFSRRKRSQKYQAKFGTEYAHTVKTMGGEKKAQDEMDARVKHVGDLPIRSLTEAEHTAFLAQWDTIQAKFLDHPAQSTIEADHLIMQVMQARNYPVSDFEQRAADVSINYPKLVSDYRAARDIAIKNEHHEATTEDLRQALIYYRSLFDELLEPEYDVVDKKYQ